MSARSSGLLLLPLLLLAAAHTAGAQSGEPEARNARLDRIVSDAMRAEQIPAVTVAAMKAGRMVYSSVPGFWSDPDGNGVHGLNERRSVRALYVSRDFLNDLIRAYADAP